MPTLTLHLLNTNYNARLLEGAGIAGGSMSRRRTNSSSGGISNVERQDLQRLCNSWCAFRFFILRPSTTNELVAVGTIRPQLHPLEPLRLNHLPSAFEYTLFCHGLRRQLHHEKGKSQPTDYFGELQPLACKKTARRPTCDSAIVASSFFVPPSSPLSLLELEEKPDELLDVLDDEDEEDWRLVSPM